MVRAPPKTRRPRAPTFKSRARPTRRKPVVPWPRWRASHERLSPLGAVFGRLARARLCCARPAASTAREPGARRSAAHRPVLLGIAPDRPRAHLHVSDRRGRAKAPLVLDPLGAGAGLDGALAAPERPWLSRAGRRRLCRVSLSLRRPLLGREHRLSAGRSGLRPHAVQRA